MRTEGNEVHETTDEARAASTPNVVRWVLAISLLAAIILLSGIWIFGAATTAPESRQTVVGGPVDQSNGDSTDSIVSDRPSLVEGGQGATSAVPAEASGQDTAN